MKKILLPSFILFSMLLILSCDKNVDPITIIVTPNPVKGVISGGIEARWDFNVIIQNNTRSEIIIDGFSWETTGLDKRQRPIFQKGDTSEINMFGQGGKWEHKNEIIPPKKQFEIGGSIYFPAFNPLISGTEKRVYRLRKPDGELITHTVQFNLSL